MPVTLQEVLTYRVSKCTWLQCVSVKYELHFKFQSLHPVLG